MVINPLKKIYVSFKDIKRTSIASMLNEVFEDYGRVIFRAQLYEKIKGLPEDDVEGRDSAMLFEYLMKDFKAVFHSSEQYSLRRIGALRYYLQDLLIKTPKNKPYYQDLIIQEALIKGIFDNMVGWLNKRNDSDTTSDLFERPMTYGFPRSLEQGHLYPRFPSLSLVSPLLCKYLSSNKYKNFVLKNPYPTILLDFAKKHEIEAPILKRLVEDKEGLYQDIMIKTNMSKDDVTWRILSCLTLLPEDPLVDNLEGVVFMLYQEILSIRDSLFVEYAEKPTDLMLYITVKGVSFEGQSIAERKLSIQWLHCFQKETEILLKFHSFLKKRVGVKSFVPFFADCSGNDLPSVGCYVMADSSFTGEILDYFNSEVHPFSLLQEEITSELEYLELDILLRYENFEGLFESKRGEFRSRKDYKPLLEYCGMPTTLESFRETLNAEVFFYYDKTPAEESFEYIKMFRRIFIQFTPEELDPHMPKWKLTPYVSKTP